MPDLDFRHHEAHELGGVDEVSLAESQIAGLVSDLAAKMVKALNLSDVADVPTAVGNLGLTSASKWVKVTKTYAQLAAAGLTNDIEAYSLPSGWVLQEAMVRMTTAFTGGLIASYTMSLGLSGTLAKYMAATSVFASPPAGITGNQIPGSLPDAPSFGGATSIRLAAISTVGLLNAATAGSIDIYLCIAQLP